LDFVGLRFCFKLSVIHSRVATHSCNCNPSPVINVVFVASLEPLPSTPQQQQLQTATTKALTPTSAAATAAVAARAMNGINGGNVPGMVGLPTPAAHQAELNYIYGMVEELSRQLAENQRTLEEVISGVGRVRSLARTHALGNEELINSAADELKGLSTAPIPHKKKQ
jgi:hypothetical protein